MKYVIFSGQIIAQFYHFLCPDRIRPQTCSFAGGKKKIAWPVWRVYNELTESLLKISHCLTAADVESIM